MKKLIAAFLIVLCTKGNAQTLFTYGNETVTATEFLNAFNKNNTKKDAKAIQEYLDLYIASRLKIKEAKTLGYDTLPQIKADLENLRAQILPAYLTDAESVDKLIKEAFQRSQKDVHVAHIYISFTNKNGLIDSVYAKQQIKEAFTRLKNGEDFLKVAKELSDDPSAKTNSGDIGYITVFSLPYELENLAYNTPVGKHSAIHQSKAGLHIFKNLGERKAIGRMKAAQILLAFPPDATANDKAQVKKRADSIYNSLIKGDDFAKLAAEFSNDYVSAATGGALPEFGVGQYDAAFEKVVFALAKDGTISKPFATAHGYHIVKRLELVKVPATLANEKFALQMREKVEQNDRINSIKDVLAKKILAQQGLKKFNFKDAELWAYTDSVLDYKSTGIKTTLQTNSSLFQLGKQDFSVADWISYAQMHRYKTDGSGIKPHAQVWNEFLQASAVDYYKSHLEEFNEDFKNQLAEFRDGNLFFEIMQQKVWSPAQNDTTALYNYYLTNKEKYKWKESADAVVFYASDASTARSFTDALKKTPQAWRDVLAGMQDKIAADSGRFEITQLPGASKNVQKGSITAPVINNDNSASFAMINYIYQQPQDRSYEEAKGLVINDYQSELEKKWLIELKKKYPVTIDQKVLADIIAGK